MILSRLDIFKVFLRSFFIQASFTLHEKLGVGFGFALLPGIKRIENDQDAIRKTLKRHSEYFNAHPFLSSFVLGAVLHLEEISITDLTETRQAFKTVKTRLAGALGSLGDRLFWKYLKPLSSLTALVLLFSFRSFYPWNILLSLISFLFIFNVFHLYYRWRGIILGYTMGLSVIRCKSIALIERLNYGIACISLGLFGLLVILVGRLARTENPKGTLILAAASLSAFFVNYKKLSPGLGLIVGLGSAFIVFIIFQLAGK